MHSLGREPQESVPKIKKSPGEATDFGFGLSRCRKNILYR